MMLWRFDVAEAEFAHLVAQDSALVMASVRLGVNPGKLRDLLRDWPGSTAFNLLDGDDKALPSGRTVPDFVVWGAYRAFSGRALAAFVAMGAAPESFVPVNIGNGERSLHWYLPTAPVDGVDLDRSTFAQVLCVDPNPPLPGLPRSLCFTAAVRTQLETSPIFVVKIPQYDQVFAEPFCTTAARERWLSHGFLGAELRPVEASWRE